MIPTWSPPWESVDDATVPSGTPDDESQRVRYHEGQFLGAVDLADEQRYHRDQQRRHLLGAHTWGVVTGFELSEVPDPIDSQFVDVVLAPGLAVDGYGRLIVSFTPVRLGAALFDAFTDEAHRGVWLTYAESPARSTAGDDCRDGAPTRTLEEFRLLVEPVQTAATVVVDGHRVVPPSVPPAPIPPDAALGPADMSVPHQELPGDEPAPPWLIRLGSVRWDGTVGRARPAAVGRLNEQRRYAGAVADHVLAPAGTLRLAPRTAADDVDAEEFTVVEGRLRSKGRLTAERELWLEGQPAVFTYDGGFDADVPLTVGRRHGPGDVGHVLRVRLGDDPAAADNTMSIGASEDPAETALEVRADGTTTIPTGHLDFGNADRQQIDLAGPGHGIGTQPGITYLRSEQQFAWFRGGAHAPGAADPGAGGQLQMLLDADGTLDFGARTRQMIDLWSVGSSHNYGIGVQSATLYFRTDFDVCWFRGGSHTDAASQPGPGGTLAMRLNSANVLDVFGDVRAAGAVQVSGELRVLGGNVHSVVKVRRFEVTCQNNGSSPGNWTTTWGTTMFDVVDTVTAMITGFSISGDVGAANPGRFPDLNVIPQHVWVEVDSTSTSGASGRAYCAQSDAGQDGNNEVRFNLLVIGRKWT